MLNRAMRLIPVRCTVGPISHTPLWTVSSRLKLGYNPNTRAPLRGDSASCRKMCLGKLQQFPTISENEVTTPPRCTCLRSLVVASRC